MQHSSRENSVPHTMEARGLRLQNRDENYREKQRKGRLKWSMVEKPNIQTFRNRTRKNYAETIFEKAKYVPKPGKTILHGKQTASIPGPCLPFMPRVLSAWREGASEWDGCHSHENTVTRVPLKSLPLLPLASVQFINENHIFLSCQVLLLDIEVCK